MPLVVQYSSSDSFQNEVVRSYLLNVNGGRATLADTWSGYICASCTKAYQLGNFDRDLASEILFKSESEGKDIFNLNSGKIMKVHSGLLGQRLRAVLDNIDTDLNGSPFELTNVDIDGDGIDELVSGVYTFDIRGAVYDVNPGDFVAHKMPSPPLRNQNNEEWKISFGDVNGDGAVDMLVYDLEDVDRLGVALSNGKGYGGIDWGWSQGLTLPDLQEEPGFGTPWAAPSSCWL